MATTKNKLAEQAGRLIVKRIGRAHLTNAERQEIQALIVQSCNAVLAIELEGEDSFGNVKNHDDMSPTAIAHFEGISVEGSAGAKYSTLPAYPMARPHDAGLWQILDAGVDLIPIPSSQRALLLGMGDEEFLEGLVGYTRRGLKVLYKGDPVSSTVDVSIIVVNPDTADGDEPLPLSPELEAAVIAGVINLFVPEPNEKS
jgi:hypothetical protein